MRTSRHLTFCLAAFIATVAVKKIMNLKQPLKKGTPAEFTMTINGGTGTRTIPIPIMKKKTVQSPGEAMKLVSLVVVMVQVIVNTPIIIMNGRLLAQRCNYNRRQLYLLYCPYTLMTKYSSSQLLV